MRHVMPCSVSCAPHLFQQIALAVVERCWKRNIVRYYKVAERSVALVVSLAFQTHLCSLLCSGFHTQAQFAVLGLQYYLAAQQCRVHVNVHRSPCVGIRACAITVCESTETAAARAAPAAASEQLLEEAGEPSAALFELTEVKTFESSCAAVCTAGCPT